MNVFARIHLARELKTYIAKIKARLTICFNTSCQCRTINCNAIWETCWTKLISVCHNGKLCEIRPVDI